MIGGQKNRVGGNQMVRLIRTTRRGRRLVIRNQGKPEDQKRIAEAYSDLYNDLLKLSKLIWSYHEQEENNSDI